MVHILNHIATRGLMPDLTIILDITSNQGLLRAEQARKKDRLENESSAFHKRVRKGYFALAKKEPKRIKIIPVVGSIEDMHEKVMKVVVERRGFV